MKARFVALSGMSMYCSLQLLTGGTAALSQYAIYSDVDLIRFVTLKKGVLAETSGVRETARGGARVDYVWGRHTKCRSSKDEEREAKLSTDALALW